MCFYLRNWQVTFLLYTLGVFISEYTAKAFTEPRDYRVVFLIQKSRMIGRYLSVLSTFRYFASVIGFLTVSCILITCRAPLKYDDSLRLSYQRATIYVLYQRRE